MGNTTLMDYLNDIARAVQSKTGKTKKIKLKDLADEIDGIDALNTHKFANDATHPLTINSNGKYNIYDNDFSHIVVDIPFAGDDLAPYFQNQTGAGPYKMVFYNHKLQKPVKKELTEPAEIGYSSYDFTVGDGGVAFLTYDYNSSSQVYADHSVSFHKHNLDSGEVIARYNYHLTNPDDEWNDNKYSDVVVVDLDPGDGSYPVIYYNSSDNSSGYLVKGENVATPGYVSWRDNATNNMSSVELDATTIIYKDNDNILATRLTKGKGYHNVAHLNSYGAITTDRMKPGNFYYIDASDEFNYSNGLVAYYNINGTVSSLSSADDDKILYYNSSSQYFTKTSLSKDKIFYTTTDGKKEEASLNDKVGIYTYRSDSGNEGVYLQKLSDQDGFNRVLVGALYDDYSFQTYKCMVDNVLYFTVSSGKAYVNTLNMEATSATECQIIMPYVSSDNQYKYRYTFDNNVINTANANKFGYSSESRITRTKAEPATLTTKDIAYLTTTNVDGYTAAYGNIANLYPSFSLNSNSNQYGANLSQIKVAYHSPSDNNIQIAPVFANRNYGKYAFTVYHLGTAKDKFENDVYCVTSTDLSYSYSNGTDGYTNNFITVLYPEIRHSTQDTGAVTTATTHQLTVTPNKYYILKSGNEFDSIGLENISPIKLGQTNPTYYWSAPVEGEAPSTPQVHTEVFGYIRIYQDPNGHSIDVPVTYEMITAIVNAGISINTDYVYPTK